MLKRIGKRLKDQRGLTLIELLAVVVILGIISAIAVPSIGGLIDNSKKDAHVANAQQMINSAKIAVTGDSTLMPAKSGSVSLSLGYLEEQGYIDKMKDPDGDLTTYTRGSGKTASGSYVTISRDTGNNLSYSVLLTNGTRGFTTLTAEGNLKRENVK